SLWAKTHGNALFLRELVLGAVHEGTLVRRDGEWHSEGELMPSDRLSEIVGARLSGLSRAESEALELVAFGEPLGVSMLSDMVGHEAVESLERNGLVNVE